VGIGTPDARVLQLARALIRQPAQQVIILAGSVDSTCIRRAVDAGVAAFLPKDAGGEELVVLIRQVSLTRTPLTLDMTESLLQRLGCLPKHLPHLRGLEDLSLQEKHVLRLLVTGASNRQIATTLGMHEKTVRNLLSELFRLFGVRNRTEAALYALREHCALLTAAESGKTCPKDQVEQKTTARKTAVPNRRRNFIKP
jgi:NarL family two-component system response regulator LiaR